MEKVEYEALTKKYFDAAIQLANKVHGEGYLDDHKIKEWVDKGIADNVNSNFVALLNNKVIGFRITYSVKQWNIDQWCSPESWNVSKEKCCYFKCNTVDVDYRGLGIGKKLLQLSINAAKKQGAQAGISHLWKQSPNNSAVSYFTQCGGELVEFHADKWNIESKQGYNCVLCGYDCHCDAAEMIIYF